MQLYYFEGQYSVVPEIFVKTFIFFQFAYADILVKILVKIGVPMVLKFKPASAPWRACILTLVLSPAPKFIPILSILIVIQSKLFT